MLLSFIYLAFVSLLKLLVRSGRPAQVKDAAKSSARGCDRVTAPSSRRQAAYSRRGAAMVCSSRRRLCSAGTVSSRGGAGHTRA
jgi:hypothetical protein